MLKRLQKSLDKIMKKETVSGRSQEVQLNHSWVAVQLLRQETLERADLRVCQVFNFRYFKSLFWMWIIRTQLQLKRHLLEGNWDLSQNSKEKWYLGKGKARAAQRFRQWEFIDLLSSGVGITLLSRSWSLSLSVASVKCGKRRPNWSSLGQGPIPVLF